MYGLLEALAWMVVGIIAGNILGFAFLLLAGFGSKNEVNKK